MITCQSMRSPSVQNHKYRQLLLTSIPRRTNLMNKKCTPLLIPFAKKKRENDDDTTQPETPPPRRQSEDTPADFWEGEQWEALGKVASFALPVMTVLALAVGFFAAQTYNQDATIFLESAKNPEDTATLYSFDK